MIPFNKPYLHGRELVYIAEAVASGKISGDGIFSKRCHYYFQERYGFQKVLLTTSCTDALEMAALLLNIGPGDEIILPSFTFVSTANAFSLRGAKLVFADSASDSPNISIATIAPLVTNKTKVIIVVHYAGVACDMDPILAIAYENGIAVVEDAAQAIDSYYKGKPLGGLGTLGAFSFHETKNVISGEGGLLTINDARFEKRAEIIREKGTNRSAFFRGEVDKYGWVDIGSSFLPSDIIAAYLYAQLEVMDNIQKKRKVIWDRYYQNLEPLIGIFDVQLTCIPSWATNNAHMFYIICRSLQQRANLISRLKNLGIHAVFHYIPLHDSPYFSTQHDGRFLPNCDRYSVSIVRLPLYFEMTLDQCDFVSQAILAALPHC